jgi:release factor glutamine methyltransferase
MTPEAATARAALARLTRQFHEAGLPEPEADARALLFGLGGLTALDLVREPGRSLDAVTLAALERAQARRMAGEPVGRILGRRSFWGLDFALSPGTLEPRHDSEALIEEALAQLAARQGRDALTRPLRFLDMGTGTGCLLLALLHECPQAVGVGVDLSLDAARTAARNAAGLGLGARALMIRSRWAEAVSGPFDLVISNPPYIESAAIATLAEDVRRHDPHLALDGGVDGLDAYRALMPMARACLAAKGVLILEIGAGQADAVTALAEGHGLAAAGRRRDLGGHVRALAFAPA